MIYLIGGPPKCGKTTLAKRLSLKLRIPWISADTLQVVAREYMSTKDAVKKFPWSIIRQTKQSNDSAYTAYTAKEIVKAYTVQAKATYGAIDMVSICEIKDGNDYIIEGYQVEPKLVNALIKKYGKNNFRSVFLTREDVDKFVTDVKKSTTPNDWVLKRTKNKATYYKIAEMISEYGKFTVREAKKYNFKIVNTDSNFEQRLREAQNYLLQ